MSATAQPLVRVATHVIGTVLMPRRQQTGIAATMVIGHLPADGVDSATAHPGSMSEAMILHDADPLALALIRTGAGDRAAFEEVYRRTSAKLFVVCLRVLRRRHEAEEALQEAYLAVWRRAGSFDVDRGSAITWLTTLARNRAIDRLRAAAQESGHSAATPDPDGPAATGAPVHGLEERRLSRCLDDLDTADAVLVRSAVLEGWTYTELAERTGRPLGTIKSRMRRAFLKLKDCLQ